MVVVRDLHHPASLIVLRTALPLTDTAGRGGNAEDVMTSQSLGGTPVCTAGFSQLKPFVTFVAYEQILCKSLFVNHQQIVCNTTNEIVHNKE